MQQTLFQDEKTECHLEQFGTCNKYILIPSGLWSFKPKTRETIINDKANHGLNNKA